MAGPSLKNNLFCGFPNTLDREKRYRLKSDSSWILNGFRSRIQIKNFINRIQGSNPVQNVSDPQPLDWFIVVVLQLLGVLANIRQRE